MELYKERKLPNGKKVSPLLGANSLGVETIKSTVSIELFGEPEKKAEKSAGAYTVSEDATSEDSAELGHS